MASADGPLALQRPILTACSWMAISDVQLEWPVHNDKMGRMRGVSYSATGTRTRVARVRAEYPNQLDYSGVVNKIGNNTLQIRFVMCTGARWKMPMEIMADFELCTWRGGSSDARGPNGLSKQFVCLLGINLNGLVV